eukprot:TRINITY_DN70941_c0_g1_i1.p1 TRINITY_DN70941_c0_g1~~TRINITY_DN70941_c0_g1_i1.p1  ORF type:complete len:263 (-),score=16.74 TRINITY_DN70941_c0_g1_i1:96-884(-)
MPTGAGGRTHAHPLYSSQFSRKNMDLLRMHMALSPPGSARSAHCSPDDKTKPNRTQPRRKSTGCQTLSNYELRPRSASPPPPPAWRPGGVSPPADGRFKNIPRLSVLQELDPMTDPRQPVTSPRQRTPPATTNSSESLGPWSPPSSRASSKSGNAQSPHTKKKKKPKPHTETHKSDLQAELDKYLLPTAERAQSPPRPLSAHDEYNKLVQRLRTEFADTTVAGQMCPPKTTGLPSRSSQRVAKPPKDKIPGPHRTSRPPWQK